MRQWVGKLHLLFVLFNPHLKTHVQYLNVWGSDLILETEVQQFDKINEMLIVSLAGKLTMKENCPKIECSEAPHHLIALLASRNVNMAFSLSSCVNGGKEKGEGKGWKMVKEQKKRARNSAWWHLTLIPYFLVLGPLTPWSNTSSEPWYSLRAKTLVTPQ